MSGLPERLAREARIQDDACLWIEGPCPVCEGIERVAASAVRAALDEAAKVAREVPVTHRESRQHPGEMVPDGIGTRAAIAAAIEALK